MSLPCTTLSSTDEGYSRAKLTLQFLCFDEQSGVLLWAVSRYRGSTKADNSQASTDSVAGWGGSLSLAIDRVSVRRSLEILRLPIQLCQLDLLQLWK